MNHKLLFLGFVFLLTSNITAKVLIFTYAYNRPDFIEIQHKTFKKYLKDEYEFIVFNDARNHNMENQINHMCTHYGIRCIRIPQEIHSRPYLQRWPSENYNDPAVRNCNVVQYSLNKVGFDHDDIVALLDSDLFLVKEFSIRTYMQGQPVAGVHQSRATGRIRYLWIGLIFLDMAILPDKRTINFNCGRVHGVSVDAGGHSHYYLERHPNIPVKYLNQRYPYVFHCDNCKRSNASFCRHNNQLLRDRGFDDIWIKFIQDGPRDMEFYQNEHFVHYRAGSNWNNLSQAYHNQKTQILRNFINTRLAVD